MENSELNKNNTPTNNQNDDPQIGVDQKLADLMMRGWVLLAESCPIETCGCPLMKNIDGQKYCAGCEMWHFEKERPVKQKFGELVSLKDKQNIQVKHTELSKLPKNILDYSMTLSKGVVQSLQLKLGYLSGLLNIETDVNKIKDILESMRICIDNIQNAKNL